MKKIVIASIIMFILIVITVSYISKSCNKISEVITEADNNYKKEIGNKYIFEKDTVTIVDYSLFNESYSLSNGQKINFNLVKKLKKIN